MKVASGVRVRVCGTLLSASLLVAVQQAIAAEQPCAEAAQLVKRGVALGDGSQQEIELYRRAEALCPRMAESNFNI